MVKKRLIGVDAAIEALNLVEAEDPNYTPLQKACLLHTEHNLRIRHAADIAGCSKSK